MAMRCRIVVNHLHQRMEIHSYKVSLSSIEAKGVIGYEVHYRVRYLPYHLKFLLRGMMYSLYTLSSTSEQVDMATSRSLT